MWSCSGGTSYHSDAHFQTALQIILHLKCAIIVFCLLLCGDVCSSERERACVCVKESEGKRGVCVCVWETERERGRERGREDGHGSVRYCVTTVFTCAGSLHGGLWLWASSLSDSYAGIRAELLVFKYFHQGQPYKSHGPLFSRMSFIKRGKPKTHSWNVYCHANTSTLLLFM